MTLRASLDEPMEASVMDLSRNDSSLDLWINRELKRSYSATLAEALPDELMRLVARFGAAR